jgi:hypothetical protein
MAKSPDQIVADIDRQQNEEDSALPKKLLGAVATVPAAIAGLGMSAHPNFPGPIDSARISGKMAYHAMTGNKEGAARDVKEFDDTVKRNKSKETKRDKGENTNIAGDTYKSGGKVSSASARADGCCVKGKTKGKMC